MHKRQLCELSKKHRSSTHGGNFYMTEARNQSLIRTQNAVKNGFFLDYTFYTWVQTQAITHWMQETMDNTAERNVAWWMLAFSRLIESFKCSSCFRLHMYILDLWYSQNPQAWGRRITEAMEMENSLMWCGRQNAVTGPFERTSLYMEVHHLA